MELDLRAYARVLFKRKWWLVGTLIITLTVGWLYTASSPRVYQTRATLFVGEQQFAIEQIGSEAVVRNLTVGLLKSYVEIVKSRKVAQRAIVDGGLDATPGEVQGGLGATAILDTQIIALTYTGPDAVKAQRITNAVADAFVTEIERLGATKIEGEPAVEIEPIDSAIVPVAPIAPNPTRNMTLAALLGLMAGVGLVYVVDHLDVRIKSREDVEALGLSMLGSVPRLETKRGQFYRRPDMQGVGGEAFRKLRTAIGFVNLERPVRSILVTSTVASEGKTTTALNLAHAFAASGLRTVLVESDLRRPSLHKVFGMLDTRGLTTAIIGDVPLSEAVMNTETHNLSVLLAGAIPPNPVELLGSDQMSHVLERLERLFDIVIIDAPPLVPVADPAALADRSDGVVVVARAGKTDRRRLVDAAQTVEKAGGRMLGVVLNYVKTSETPYDYGYYYSYAPTPSPTASE